MNVRRLAKALLYRVYSPVTVVASVDAGGKCVALSAYDSRYLPDQSCLHHDAAQVFVIFGHPEGSRKLTARENRSLVNIRRMAKRTPVRAFICGEDIGCFEVDSVVHCGYNRGKIGRIPND